MSRLRSGGWEGTANIEGNDEDPEINPDSDEICDGGDNDCKGEVPAGELDEETSGGGAGGSCDCRQAGRTSSARTLFQLVLSLLLDLLP